MTFQETKKPTGSVSINKFEYLFKFYEKNHKKRSLDKKFENKIQTAVSGTDHTITTSKNKIINRKLISNPLPFQQTITAPTKWVTTRQNDQPSCSKTLDATTSGGNPCIYTKKETPRPINYERSEDWLKRKEKPRINKGPFTSPSKNPREKEMDLNLSNVSDEEFDCYNKSDGKPVKTNIDDELHLLPKNNKLTPDQGIYIEKK